MLRSRFSFVTAVFGSIVSALGFSACVGDTAVNPTPAKDASTLPDTSLPDSAQSQDTSIPMDAADAGPLPLPNVGAGHLQLWLTADRDVTCKNNEVTAWADQSTHARIATHGNHKGPQCPTSGHTQKGVNLPYLSAPGSNSLDETLDIDLTFLNNTDFTIFVVERRWADRTGGNNEFLLGTKTTNVMGCTVVFFGYSYYDGYPTLNYEPTCGGVRGKVPAVPNQPPTPFSVDEVRYTQSDGLGQTVWQNGVKVSSGMNAGTRLTGLSGGTIGWGGDLLAENRFQGDIAEIVIFDAGLTVGEIGQIEAYFKAHWGL